MKYEIKYETLLPLGKKRNTLFYLSNACTVTDLNNSNVSCSCPCTICFYSIRMRACVEQPFFKEHNEIVRDIIKYSDYCNGYHTSKRKADTPPQRVASLGVSVGHAQISHAQVSSFQSTLAGWRFSWSRIFLGIRLVTLTQKYRLNSRNRRSAHEIHDCDISPTVRVRLKSFTQGTDLGVIEARPFGFHYIEW